MCPGHCRDQPRVRVCGRCPLVGHDELHLEPTPPEPDRDVERDGARSRILTLIVSVADPAPQRLGEKGHAESILLDDNPADEIEQKLPLLSRPDITDSVAQTRCF